MIKAAVETHSELLAAASALQANLLRKRGARGIPLELRAGGGPGGKDRGSATRPRDAAGTAGPAELPRCPAWW